MERLSSPELKTQGFSPHLQYFIQKMMTKQVEDRYQGFEQLIEAVKGYLHDAAATRYRCEAFVFVERGLA